MGVTLFALGKKALTSLQALSMELLGGIECVVVGRDKGVADDFADEMIQWLRERQIKSLERDQFDWRKNSSQYQIAIGWRWINNLNEGQKLIVLHDSLLPKYRGFNPLVTALINGDRKVGVTAILGGLEFDKGDIIAQKMIEIAYPITISEALKKTERLYVDLLVGILATIGKAGKLRRVRQLESAATYSLWRDDDDYAIDWTQDAVAIRRFVDAVGYPYKGAHALYDGRLIRILEVEVIRDVKIVNRDVGKVIFRADDCPVVVCGKGLIQIRKATGGGGERIAFENKFRIRFT